MLSNVFLKTLRDQRWPTFWFGLALVAIGLYTIMFYPLIAEATGLLEFIENLPEELTAMFGGALDYSTAEGFLSGELFSFTGPLVVIAYAIFRGATVVAGEEEARTLDQLLANPVPRWRILIEKSAAVIIGIAVLGVVFWSALVVGAKIAGVSLSYSSLASGVVGVSLLATACGTFALMISGAVGKRNMAAGVAGGITLAMFLLNAFQSLVDVLRPGRFASFFYYYEANEPLIYGLSVAHALVLLAVSVVAIAIGAVAFSLRDLR